MTMQPYRTILWASDGSEGADAALAEAVRVAETTGAHLLAVHCDQRLNGRAGNWSVLPDEEDVRTRVGRQVSELKRRGVDAEFLLRHSHQDAADVVAAIAAERDVDLIVCGTRGLGALGRFLLGSFTQRLLHVAPCAVLAVPDRGPVAKEPEPEKSEARA